MRYNCSTYSSTSYSPYTFTRKVYIPPPPRTPKEIPLSENNKELDMFLESFVVKEQQGIEH